MNKLNTIDLFAGAGGLSYGFLQTGCFNINVAVESNKYAQETYKKNHDVIAIEPDIKSINYKQLLVDYGQVDVVIGGPPCQGFSNANRQKNELVSDNNQLVKQYIRAIDELRPLAFVMENVKAISSKNHKFFYCKKDEEKVAKLKLTLNDEVLPIAEAAFESDALISFLKNNKTFDDYILSKDNYIKLNTIYRSARTHEQLTTYFSKYRKNIEKILKSWDNLHNKFWNKDYRNVFINTKVYIQRYLDENIEYNNLKDNLRNIIEVHKAFYKIDEIKKYEIELKDIVCEKKNICVSVKTYNIIKYLTETFTSFGYKIISGVLNAAEFGVPQVRERYIIIGVREDALKSDNLNMPKALITDRKNYYTISDAIKDLGQYGTSSDVNTKPILKSKELKYKNFLLSYLNKGKQVYNHVITSTTKNALERFKKLKQGQNFHDLPDELKTTYSDAKRTQKTIYQRLNYEEPSGTVLNIRKSMWIHPEHDRAISIREAARLQAFPDDFIFKGPKDSQYQQIGNAVPPLLGRAIAEKILELLGREPQTKLKDIIFNKEDCEIKDA